MSQPAPSSKALRTRLRGQRQLRWLLIALAAFVVFLICVRLYAAWEAEADLAAAIAEADATDPGWRWEDLEKQRAIVPDEINGAIVVLAAAKQIPDAWWDPPKVDAQTQRDRLFGALQTQEPVQLLDVELLAVLREQVASQNPALIEARKLLKYPSGRFQVTWARDVVTSPMPHLSECRKLINLLELASAWSAHNGNASDAIAFAKMALNVGRAIGTEPHIYSQLTRVACQRMAVRMLERALALNPTDQPLAEIQEDFRKEATNDLVPLMARGERAAQQKYGQAILEGTVRSKAGLWGGDDLRVVDDLLSRWLYHDVWVRYGQGTNLKLMNEAVLIARQPIDKQWELWQEFDSQEKMFHNSVLTTLAIRKALGHFPFGATIKTAEAQRTSQMFLTCAAVAIAAERFRLQEKRWPENLQQLTPHFLPAVPRDFFRPAPLSLRHVDDGLVIYSVGHDGKDHGGVIDRTRTAGFGSDIGFRLWDPDKRRQPAPAKNTDEKSP